MQLGAFSISLNVKDIKKSYAFYSKLGIQKIGGNIDQLWLILKNKEAVIGLFQNMIEKNTLTFNPGWDQEGSETDQFMDVRAINQELNQKEIPVVATFDCEKGPGYLQFEDPDGNPILIDQHR
jgi:catechol 2,3-dioxygenase-like lactoylglutathione lyase family enzyme